MHFGQKYGKIKENKCFSGVGEVKSASRTPFFFAEMEKTLVYFYAFFTETKNAQTGGTGEI